MDRRPAELAVGEAPGERRNSQAGGGSELRPSRRDARVCDEKVAEPLAWCRPEPYARRALQRHTGRRQHAGDGHEGDETEHHQRQKGAQIAAAGAGQVAARAAAGQHHADAEDQPPGDMAQPVERRCEVHRAPEVDDAGGIEQRGPDQGRGRGEHPGPEAPVVAEVVDIGERAHGAVVGAVDNEPEQEADGEATQGQHDRGILANGFAESSHSSCAPFILRTVARKAASLRNRGCPAGVCALVLQRMARHLQSRHYCSFGSCCEIVDSIVDRPW